MNKFFYFYIVVFIVVFLVLSASFYLFSFDQIFSFFVGFFGPFIIILFLVFVFAIFEELL